MKRLQEYIVESTSDFILLKTFEEAKKWFNEVGWITNDDDSKLKNKMGISINDIGKIYDIADHYNKIAPLVGNYKSRKVFAMRRWIDNYINEWSKETNNLNINDDWFWTKKSGIYGGPHNTKLKEDGSFNPTAEDMESVIAFAINHIIDPTYNDYENMNYVCNIKKKKPNQKIENLLNYYQDEKKFIDNMAIVISDKNVKFHKLLTENNKCTELWKELGTYKETGDQINNTPKTDLISEDHKIKLSLKKSHGSQLMSGAFSEAKATILYAAQKTLKQNEINKLKDILDISKHWTKLSGNSKGISKQKQTGSDNIKQIIKDSEQSAKIITEQLNELLKNNIEFKRTLFFEAMTGNVKFGENSLSSANYIFVWSNKASENKLYTVEEYLDEIITHKHKVEVTWKTGGTSSYQTLRITTY